MIKYHNVIKKGEKRMKPETKEKINKATKLIESCWDENNPDDGKTFDQRLQEKIVSCEDEELKKILIGAAEGI